MRSILIVAAAVLAASLVACSNQAESECASGCESPGYVAALIVDCKAKAASDAAPSTPAPTVLLACESQPAFTGSLVGDGSGGEACRCHPLN